MPAHTPAPTQRHGSPSASVLVIALLMLQTILLSYRLADQSLWTDEGYSAYLTYLKTPAEVLQQVRRIERRPPLQFISLWFWSQAAGRSDLSLKYQSVMFTLAATALIFQLGKRVLSERAGVWAALLMATAPTVFLYGRMIRGYAMTMTLGLAATLAFWNAWQRKRLADWAVYLICTTLLLTSDYPALSILAGHLLYVATQWREVVTHWRRLLLPVAGLGFVLLFFWAILQWQASSVNIQGFSTPLGFLTSTSLLSYVKRLPNILLGGVYMFYSFTFGETLFPWYPLVWAGGAGVLVWAWQIAQQYQRNPSQGKTFSLSLLSATFTLACLVLCGLIFANSQIVVVAARALFIAPFFYLVLSLYGEARSGQHLRTGVLIGLLATRGLALLNGLTDPGSVFNPVYAVPVGELAAQVARNVQPGDVVIFEEQLPFDLYFRQLDATTPLFTLGPHHYGNVIGPDVPPGSPAFLGQGQPAVAAIGLDRLLAYLKTNPPTRLWFVVFHAEWTEQTTETQIGQPLIKAGLYQFASRIGYARQDPLYARLRTLLNPRTPIQYKAEIVLYIHSN